MSVEHEMSGYLVPSSMAPIALGWIGNKIRYEFYINSAINYRCQEVDTWLSSLFGYMMLNREKNETEVSFPFKTLKNSVSREF